MTDTTEPLPTTAVNADPSVVSDLLELDDSIAREIMYLTHGIEGYKNIRHSHPRSLSLGLEADAGVISRMLDALIRFFKKMARDIYDGGATLGYSLGKLGERAENLDTESRTGHRTNKSSNFTINTRIANLCINYKPLSDIQNLLMVIKSTDPLFRGYYRWHSNVLGEIIPEIVALDPARPESLDRLISLMQRVAPSTVASTLGLNGSIVNLTSPHLLGNVRLHVINKTPNGDAYQQLVGQEILLLPSSDDVKPIPSSLTFNNFSKTVEQSTIRQILTTIGDLEHNFNLSSRSKRLGRVDQLNKYLERLRNMSINTVPDSIEPVENIEKMIRLLTTYVNWLLNPYLNLVSLYIRNMTAVLNVCEANN